MIAKAFPRFAWLLLLSTLVLFQSCKKEDPEPATPADEVAGNYVGTKYKEGTQEVTLPYQPLQLSTKMVLTKKTDTTVDALITVAANGTSQDFPVEFTLNRTSTGIDFLEGTDKLGMYSNKTFTLNLEDTDGTPLVFTFAKQ